MVGAQARLKTKPTMTKMSTTIGILGTGRMAVRLAKLFADCGQTVILSSRTPERAAHITKGLNIDAIRPGTYEQAADAPVVQDRLDLHCLVVVDVLGGDLGRIGWGGGFVGIVGRLLRTVFDPRKECQPFAVAFGPPGH